MKIEEVKRRLVDDGWHGVHWSENAVTLQHPAKQDIITIGGDQNQHLNQQTVNGLLERAKLDEGAISDHH
jgi:predicted RNA binding protein YcfA (HicA-like mRNA interferase family)